MTTITQNIARRTLRLVLPLAAALVLGACAAPGGTGSGPNTAQIGQAAPFSTAAMLQGAADHPPPLGLAQSGGSLGLRPIIPSGPLLALGNSNASSTTVAVASLEAPRDLWERMRRSFAMPDLDTDLVRQHERWHVSRPQNLERMVLRSSKYLFHIVEEVERRGLPMEVALVPLSLIHI